jgi:ribosomal protein L32
MSESEWIEVEPVDELAIEAAMDYCETCGKYTAGDDACVACGTEVAWGVACGTEDAPEHRSGDPA